ncbi:MAG: hypothetical protein P9L94_12510 [Candidatus Hinthialibacter antarcticus]|nr:hypothetical protein [Candidatus Hinthialibacter antarcticus]
MQNRALFAFLPIALSLAVTSVYAQGAFIDADSLDIDRIRKEEQLAESNKLVRIYFFVAVKKDGAYKAFAASGAVDVDDDGKSVLKEPNDIKEYEEVGSFERDLKIDQDSYTCYISSLPFFDDLFPEESDPIEQEGAWLEIDTEKKDDITEKQRHLVGAKTLPMIDLMGEQTGIEHFIAFYNADKESNDVESYGFISLQFKDE